MFPSLIGAKGWNAVKWWQVHFCKRQYKVFARQTHWFFDAQENHRWQSQQPLMACCLLQLDKADKWGMLSQTIPAASHNTKIRHEGCFSVAGKLQKVYFSKVVLLCFMKLTIRLKQMVQNYFMISYKSVQNLKFKVIYPPIPLPIEKIKKLLWVL